MIARLVLRTVAAALCVAAGVAIAALLGGDFGDPQDRIVLTSLSFAVATALAGAGAALIERRRTPGEVGLGVFTASVAALAFALGMVELWTEGDDDFLLRTMGIAIVLSLGGAQLSLLAVQARPHDAPAVRAAGALGGGAGLIATLLGSVAIAGGGTRSDAFTQGLGVMLVLAVLGTLLAPVLRRTTGRRARALPPSTATLDHVQVAAPPGCEAAARAFYGELLGLAEQPKPAGLAARGGVWFHCVHVGVQEPFAPARKAHPALRVADLDGLVARLRAAGHQPRFDEDIPGVRRFYVDDPWGNRIELIG